MCFCLYSLKEVYESNFRQYKEQRWEESDERKGEKRRSQKRRDREKKEDHRREERGRRNKFQVCKKVEKVVFSNVLWLRRVEK